MSSSYSGKPLSSVPFHHLNLNAPLISATGSKGKIKDYDFRTKGNHFQLTLVIGWESGQHSRVDFPSDCENIHVG